MLTFFGFMHGEAVGFAVTPVVAAAYAMVAAFLFALSRAGAAEPAIKAPAASNSAQEKSRRSLMFTEYAVFCRRRPICSAIDM